MALSKVIGVYRLSQDVELRYLPSGIAVAKLNLVNSSKYKTQDGTQKEDICFIEGTVFGKLAEIANQYLKKGSKIYVVAELKQETWQDQNGQNRSKHSLKIESFEMLDGKPNDNQRPKSQTQNNYQPKQETRYTPPSQPKQEEFPEIDDTDIPF